MPVTLSIVDHPAVPWPTSAERDPCSILENLNRESYKKYKGILQTSYNKTVLGEQHISPSTNGLVLAALDAYSAHHHLTIRPEDIWFAILTQLSFYINAHAEELRYFFVDHEGQEELVVEMVGTRHTVDFGSFAQQMANLLGKKVKDPELRDWVMPDFSTTTDEDRAVGAILFMGAMQKYFSYECVTMCGIPSVTLLGDVEDWEKMLAKVDLIERLGEEPALFAARLRVILEYMVLSFREPESVDVVEFWNKIIHRHSRGSGHPYISGWMAVFCTWSDEGKMLSFSRTRYEEGEFDFEAYIAGSSASTVAEEPADKKKNMLSLSSLTGLQVDIPDIPPGAACVPVLVNDNGEKFKCTMVAGSAAIRATAPTEAQRATLTSKGRGAKTAIQPKTGWWICINEDEALVEERENKIKEPRDEFYRLLKKKYDAVAGKVSGRGAVEHPQ